MLEIRLCGGLSLRSNAQVVPDALLAGRQGRLVFAYLACERHRAVPREELADLLWPAAVPASWTTSLSAVISRLRKMLNEVGLDGVETLAAPAGAYQLLLPGDAVVDWEVAQREIVAAESAVEGGDATRALELAADVARIVEKGFIADDCPWVDRQRDSARDLLVRALLARGAAHLQTGAPARAIDVARDALTLDGTREASFRLLMRALARAGERAEALRVWERCRTTLVDELGVDPSPETEAVYLDILGAVGEPPPSRATNALPSGVITFLLTDIVESSALWEREPAAMAVALERHDALVAEIVRRCGGTLLKSKLEGDATVSVFTRATAGMAAALMLRNALLDEPWPTGAAPRVRMALHTGEAYERDGDYFGPALNRAARLRSLATADQVLLSQAVAELVRDHIPVDTVLIDRGHRDLRGLSRGENVYELAARTAADAETVISGAFAPPDLPGSLVASGPFVGRDNELRELNAEWELARAGAARSVLVGGEPGVGKSRLVAEAARVAHENGAVVLYGRCDEELGMPYQPFVEAVRVAAPALGAQRLREMRGVENLVRMVPELGDLIPDAATATRADPETERYALFGAVTQLLVTASSEAPLLVVLDDLHWAGKTTLALLRHVLREAGDAPLLILATYRDTELSRTHPLAGTIADLRGDGLSRRVTLAGLPADDVAAYLAAVGHNDRALGRELAKVTSGNPFFLIEALRHVEETGGRWQPGSLPEGVKEATGRRLSRLSEDASAALSTAAVVGSTFALDVVESLQQRDLVEPMAEACRAGLVIEELDQPGTFRFAHALVRQVLLAELVTVKRVRMHRSIAELLERHVDEREPDAFLTDLAHHWFECASAGAADKAVSACMRAAEHAMGRLAYEEAADLFGMAIEAVDAADTPDPELVARLHLARCDALLTAGEVALARPALDALDRVGRASSRLRAWHTTFSGQLAVLAEPERLVEVVDRVGAAAQVMRQAGDVVGEAKAGYVHALALERLGRIGEAETALDAALAAARAADDRHLADAILAEVPLAVLWGPSPVTRASGRCLDIVRVCRITEGAAAVESVALRCQAVLEALRGRTDAARRMVGSARRTVVELGLAHHRLETDVAVGFIELLAGDAIAAENVLRPASEELRDRGLHGEAARAAGLLGRALLIQGRTEDAEAAALDAKNLAGADLRANIIWRGVLAEVAARAGDTERALALAEEAVELSAPTDALLPLANARLSLASVYAISGDVGGAGAEARRAEDVCAAKGATVLVEAARAIGRELTDGETDGSSFDGPLHLAPYENDGSELIRRIHAVIADGSLSELANFYAPGLVIDDHRRPPRLPLDLTVAPDAVEVVRANNFRVGMDVIGSRGARLVLARLTTSDDNSVFDMAVALEAGDGQITWGALFDADALDDAFAAMDQRYITAESAPNPDVTRSYLTFIDSVNHRPWRDVRDQVAEDFEYRDYRGASGTPMSREELGAMWADFPRRHAGGRTARVEHVLETSANALLGVLVLEGDVAADGGPYEDRVLEVVSIENGRIACIESFYEHDLDTARVRFEDLTAGESAPRRVDPFLRFANEAALVANEIVAAFESGDGRAIQALLTDDATFADNRRLIQLGESQEMMRAIPEEADKVTMRIDSNLVATRGDRLIMGFGDVSNFSDASNFGIAMAVLLILRSDGRGKTDRVEWYDAERFAEVYERFEQLDAELRPAAPRPRPEEFLGPERGTGFRLHHEQCVGDYVLSVWSPRERERSGLLDDLVVSVVHLDSGGQVDERHVFEHAQMGVAFELFDSLTAPTSREPSRFANRASRMSEQALVAFHSGDAKAIEAFAAPDMHIDDRRRLVGGDYDGRSVAQFVARDPGVLSLPLLATRGDDFALHKAHWHSDSAEFDLLFLGETNAQGKNSHQTWFDKDDFDAAYALLDERYLAAQPSPWFVRRREHDAAVASADWATAGTFYADDVVVEDHRPDHTGKGRGRGVAVDALRAAVADAADQRVRVHHFLESGHCALLSTSWLGDAVTLNVFQHNDAGEVAYWDVYSDAQHAEAFERYDALVTQAELPHANQVVAAVRRRAADADPSWRVRRVIATRGDTLALVEHANDAGGTGTTLFELDGDGHVLVVEEHDEDDLPDAYRSLNARYVELLDEPLKTCAGRMFESFDAYSDGNLEPWFAASTEDFKADFSPRLLFEPMDRDAFMKYLTEMLGLAPNSRVVIDHVLAFDAGAALALVNVRGEADTGDFELPSIGIMEFDASGKASAIHFFTVEEMDDAQSAFDAIVEAAPPRT